MKLVVSFSPHIHRNISIPRIMYTVVLALMPIFIWAVYLFGIRLLLLVLIACVTACVTEAVLQVLMKKKRTCLDGSAILTGILLAFNIPVQSPYWVPVIGSVFAVSIAKQAFGGLGYNFINPALAGRAFLTVSWPQIMTGAKTTANPLYILQAGSMNTAVLPKLNSEQTIFNLLFGFHGSSVAESSALFVLAGGVFLILMKYIDWRIPFSYIMTVGIIMQILFLAGITQFNGAFHILAGGLFLGAFFMATDYVTSPITKQGKWFFGIGCGIMTVIIRLWGAYPDGVCYSILLMNCFNLVIERNIKAFKLKEVKREQNLLLTT